MQKLDNEHHNVRRERDRRAVRLFIIRQRGAAL